MKWIKLHAYMVGNLGDDLMIETLLRRFPQYTFFADCTMPSGSYFARHENYVDRTGLYAKYSRMNRIVNQFLPGRKDMIVRLAAKARSLRCRCSVYIGGSLFIEAGNETVSQRISRESRKLEGKPLFIIGCNFGPYRTKMFREEFAKFFSRCAGVTFRDCASYEMFSHLPQAAYAPDVVLNLAEETTEQAEETVLISVLDVRSRASLAPYAGEYMRFMAEACKTCVAQGKIPVLMSFCESEGDMAMVKQILDILTPETRQKVRVFDYQGDMQQAIDVFRKAGFVVATRFHAMILALCFGKPFFAVSYSDKIKCVLQDLKCDAFCSMEQLAALKAAEVLSRHKQPVQAQTYIAAAKQQFDQLDRYMKNG